jgi:hypothetical protein
LKPPATTKGISAVDARTDVRCSRGSMAGLTREEPIEVDLHDIRRP